LHERGKSKTPSLQKEKKEERPVHSSQVISKRNRRGKKRGEPLIQTRKGKGTPSLRRGEKDSIKNRQSESYHGHEGKKRSAAGITFLFRPSLEPPIKKWGGIICDFGG